MPLVSNRPNPLRIDPTRTATLRRKFETELIARFERLKVKLRKYLLTDDKLELKALVGNARFKFNARPERIEEFRKWLATQVEDEILGDPNTNETAWWDRFIAEGYRQGAGRAFDDTMKPYARGYAKTGGVSDFYKGTKYQFLQSSFAQPETVEKVQLLASRVFTELKGVTDAMSQKMTRDLTEGLSKGDNPLTIAKQLASGVDSVGEVRARAIARTEIVRAHNEGQLDALEGLGVEEVGVMVEWSTAMNACPLCTPLEGVTITLKEARGMLPRHPNCVIGESIIEASDIVSVLKTHYTGKVIEIATATGCRFTVTENHILLTEHGFMPAKFIQLGIKILDATLLNSELRRTPNDNRNKTSIADIFTSLSKDTAMLTRSLPLSSEYLHGDGSFCNPEINIVWPDRELRNQVELSSLGVEGQFVFSQGLGIESSLSTSSPRAEFLKAVYSTFDSSMGSFREILALLLGRLRHSQEHGFTSVSLYNTEFLQSLVDNCARTPIVFRECLNAHPVLKQLTKFLFGDDDSFLTSMTFDWLSYKIEIPFDNLRLDTKEFTDRAIRETISMLLDHCSNQVTVFISRTHVTNLPVYDVQTESSLYSLNGLTSSNCRCSWIPANVGESTKGQVRGKKNIEEAIDKSVEAELPKTKPRTLEEQKEKTSWAGADASMSKQRPKPVVSPQKK